MKQNSTRRGFTLIELLVVVIIIAILAAIALPQYNKAVMKSRLAALKPIAKSVKDAQEIYFNREGKYAGGSELADLDIGIPQGTSLDISATGEHQYIRANNPAGLPHNSYTMYFDRSENYAGNVYCEACDNDANATALCIAEGGLEGPTNGNCKLYLLQGNSTGGFEPVALTPTATNVTCRDSWTTTPCDIYTLENGHTIEISDWGAAADGRPITCITEYDGGSSVFGACYIGQNMACEEAACGGIDFCDAYPTLDICNH